MTLIQFFNPRTPIATRFQAARAADGAAAVWGLVAIMFGFGFLVTIWSPRPGPAGLPDWSVHLGLALFAVGMGFATNRSKTLFLAVIAAGVAAVMSAYAVLGFLVGKGALIGFAIIAVPFAIQGVRGARALRRLTA